MNAMHHHHPPHNEPDEGFHSQPGSDTTSQPDDDDDHHMMLSAADDTEDARCRKLKAELLDLPRVKRLKLVKEVCGSFPTAILFELHNAIGGLVYFDPVRYLPVELILHIFSYLTPRDILTASEVSRQWREKTNDETLWRICFGREGWILDRSRMSVPESIARAKGARSAENVLRCIPTPLELERRVSRKRLRSEAFNSENESTNVNTGGPAPHADLSDNAGSMEGVEPAPPSTNNGTMRATNGNIPGTTVAANDALSHMPRTCRASSSRARPDVDAIRIHPPLFSSAEPPKVSWPYLYKQRRKLEKNWELGKYKMFQLPDPEHLSEGHSECVYTIQHSGKWLVSGSRDRSIRIWDLSTYRLRIPPLQKHEASVLCLQFDERPGEKHNLLVSGGSDNFVIAWRFDTGEVIKKWKAHSESVLNLRFDDRYLVTCSKDKTIKIWNRHAIASNDPLIPRCVESVWNAAPEPSILSPFTELKAMVGHQAAVNAVQINGDVIVSASGDRSIKSWDIHEGISKKTYMGHTKGIACVQFDGRRIVSGSSDNSVRIFDYETTAEVACLDGHNNLVRTVQARFGDLETISDDELYEESRRADEQFFRGLKSGLQAAEVSRRRAPRNAGSSRPQDMLAIGTKIPPGGGGSRWAKIVSGSYDETVIVWKRNKDGNWTPSLRLHQGMLLSHPTSSNRIRPTAVPQPTNLNNINAQPINPQQATANQQAQHLLAQAQSQLTQVNSMLQNPPLAHAHALSHSQVTAMTAAQANLNAQMQTLAAQQHQQALNQVTTTTGHDGTANTHTTTITAQTNNNHPPAAAATAVAANANQPQQQQAAAPAPVPHGNNQANAGQGHHHHHAHHHHHHHAAAANANGSHQRDSNRVFKLQFDARRIIACSQNKVIVGWDFANGERDLEWIGDWSIETA